MGLISRIQEIATRLHLKAIGIAAGGLEEGPDTDRVSHPLTNDMGIRPGKIVISGVTSTENCPMSATIIADDESVSYPGDANFIGSSGSPPIYTWTFTWEALPELGCDAVLRIEELCPQPPTGDGAPLGFSGASVTLTVHVLEDFKEGACSDDRA